MGAKQISIHELYYLANFLSKAGKSLERFRYFSSRPLSVIGQHLVTVLYFDEQNEPIAYGHLDNENGTVWLGTCVAEKETGKGFGTKVMQALLNFAREKKISKIRLSVDNINLAAQKLYTSFGFTCVDKKESISFFEWEATKNPEILVSTLAFIGKSAEEIIHESKENNWCIEFSSGMPYREDMESVFLSAPLLRYAHNYFPAPQKPFVLNLASSSTDIRKKSVEHCIRGLELSEQVGARFFSAHAGFCIDPSPEELGNPIAPRKFSDRQSHFNYFVDSVLEILNRTKDLNAQFLIENNVIAKMNLYAAGINPLLCCESSEIEKLMQIIPDQRLGLLLDTGHLKVSCETLGLDKMKELEKLSEFIVCIHHSDNSGVNDTNEALGNDYWFLPFINRFPFTTHVLEVKKLNKEKIQQQLFLLRSGISP